MDRSDELFRDRLRSPEQYAAEPGEAITLYCGRFLQILGWAPVMRTCRIVIAEADRLPEAAIESEVDLPAIRRTVGSLLRSAGV